ncbi:carboxylating nicotinate-nucleotide diphosphorylase [Prochlorococcus marinus]|uniref:carboxylating nicotinate-nucleotide diphosphorylase n=1 Tax=Prochlorococcus marinus TaxID=1219 RepID=UPI0022B3DA12|nr:carboxylating nicotinate-nucleotide diphosphorylase [Prochlorococcus marinus]
MNILPPTINHLLDIWLNEDVGRGDLTQTAISNDIVNAHWISKQEGVFCGGDIVKTLYKRLDQNVKVDLKKKDGENFKIGEKILELQGPVSVLLAGERTSLNLAMHLSGIATKTQSLVFELKGTGVRLADTRKTTPGLRQLEKYAVRCGGGLNHRLGLDDAAMLKENHIAWGKGINHSIKCLRESIPWTTKIIVEAETKSQAKEAVMSGADGVLLDEMTPVEIVHLVPHLRKLAAQISKEIVIEASGIDPLEIKNYASTGVDIISSSAPITKSTWIDFSMRFNSNTIN